MFIKEAETVEGLKFAKETIDKKTKNIEKLLSDAEKYNKLKANFYSKKAIAEDLKSLVEQKIVEQDVLALKINILHSSATPPISPTKPNVRYIFIINFIISFFIAAAIILIRQLNKKMVFDINQVTSLMLRRGGG